MDVRLVNLQLHKHARPMPNDDHFSQVRRYNKRSLLAMNNNNPRSKAVVAVLNNKNNDIKDQHARQTIKQQQQQQHHLALNYVKEASVIIGARKEEQQLLPPARLTLGESIRMQAHAQLADSPTLDHSQLLQLRQDEIMMFTDNAEGPPTPSHTHQQGLGVIEFLQGKHIFITGATGFLAKVLVEKILRVQPHVGQLFLLIKAQDLKSAKERMVNEIMNTNLFNTLRKQHGDSFEDFIRRKVTPIVGNITYDNLGMDPNTIENLSSKVDIIVNSAASTNFDERYDHALNLNTKGAQRVLEFSKKCHHIQLLMHVSTAFVNGTRKGLVKENTFQLGQSIAKEKAHLLPKGENIFDLNVEEELDLVRKTYNALAIDSPDEPSKNKDKVLIQAMKDLGMKRAHLFGWQDTYVFTKAMGEMLIDSMRDEIPVVILRPSVIESSFIDPFPGWMEGSRMMDPIILLYGKGHLPGFLADTNGVLDVVPVDMVANSMLASMAKHSSKPGLQVYQVASSVVNPLVFGELARLSYEHFQENPFIDKKGKPVKPTSAHLFKDINTFMEHLLSSSKKMDPISNHHLEGQRGRSQLYIKAIEQASYLASLYQPYTFYAGRFDNSNTEKLYDDLCINEKEIFKFDVREIDWEAYIKEIHIPGLRKHVLKGRGSNTGHFHCK